MLFQLSFYGIHVLSNILGFGKTWATRIKLKHCFWMLSTALAWEIHHLNHFFVLDAQLVGRSVSPSRLRKPGASVGRVALFHFLILSKHETNNFLNVLFLKYIDGKLNEAL